LFRRSDDFEGQGQLDRLRAVYVWKNISALVKFLHREACNEFASKSPRKIAANRKRVTTVL